MVNFIAVGNNEPTPDNLPDEIKKIINDGKKKAGFNPDGTQPDHIVDMHEMVKDTNQASELVKGAVFYASKDAQQKRLYKEGYKINTSSYHRLLHIEPNFVQLDLDSSGTSYVHVSLTGGA